MTSRRGPGTLAVLAALATLVLGCGDTGPATPLPSASSDAGAATPVPSFTERPFQPDRWPLLASACDVPGYTGLLGRVEAPSARTVRFVLCRPDGAFLARLAHPALGVVDAAAIAALEAEPQDATLPRGAGAFRVEAWGPGDEIRLVRTDAGTAPERVVLRWAPTSATRAAALRDATVDVIDDPSPTDAGDLETLPELVVIPRSGLATAYLGFGTGGGLDKAPVRRAFAEALDHDALARDAFDPGATAAAHLAPCTVPGGCEGTAWYAFNGPDAIDALDLAGVDRKDAIHLHVPDAPVPGLPDPERLAEAVRDQLAASIAVTVRIDTEPVDELRAAIEAGDVEGFYLWGVASSLPDATGFLEPVLGASAKGVAADRSKGVRSTLADAAAALDPGVRLAAIGAANDALRSSAPVIPLVHPGSTIAARADVTGLVTSPLGVDPLGAAVPGDRRQLVVMSAAAPGATWCGIAPDPGSLRLCALVTPGLYAFEGGGLDPMPALAERCTATSDLRTWTCRLRDGVDAADGARLDAGDVVASIRAQADATGPLRAALPIGAFAAWDALFDGPVPAVTGSP